MQPSMSNVMLQWHPPKGYSVVDSSPRNLGTLFSGNSYSSFAFLCRTDPLVNGTHDGCGDIVVPTGTATLTGLVSGQQVEIEVDSVTLPPLSALQSREMTSLLSRSAVWSKMRDLELQALSTSRKNSQNDSTEERSSEPLAKKPRLNGSCTSSAQQKPLLENHLREELSELSLRSGILCPLTYLKSECGSIRQIVPLPHSSLGKPVKTTQAVHLNSSLSITSRKRKSRSSHGHHNSLSDGSFTLSSFAKNTISAIGSTLKTVANITTFGLVSPDTSPAIENGQSIDDEIEYREKRHCQLHWDEEKGSIVYPDIYYRSHHRHNGSSEHLHRAKRSRRSHSSRHAHRPTTHLPPAAVIPTAAPLPDLPLTEAAGPENHSGEEEDEGLTISDTESDSSVDPDWEDLHKPNELLPIIHIQLFSGAWPLVRAFSYAVGVPLEEIRKLPLCVESTDYNNVKQMNGHTNGGEKNAHLWATALAVACLEEHFSELRSEWEVVAYKGCRWIEHNLRNTKFSLDQVHRTARELVQRRS